MTVREMILGYAKSQGLKENKKTITWRDLPSLCSLFAPGALFAVGLSFLYVTNDNYSWVDNPLEYPWELYAISICGIIATVGGIADWLFHRLYVTTGPKERRSHLLALATGGIPLFIIMSLASISSRPQHYLIPMMIVGLYTVVLICYDEFLFHWKRCKPLETLFHRLLVFGNGCAWLAWIHWCFVRSA
jgi:hypothetical protein